MEEILDPNHIAMLIRTIASQVMSVKQAADFLGIPRQYIYDLLKQERLSTIHIGGYKTLLRSEVEWFKVHAKIEFKNGYDTLLICTKGSDCPHCVEDSLNA